jgi:hypothetical protein
VKLPNTNLEATQPGPAAPSSRTFWNTILTATPVILTVMATILAGLSSRELTLSQYHRALAAQNQSKAGDQWNFFQAKRGRRAIHENTIDLLQARAESGKVDAAALEGGAEFLLQRLRRVERDGDHLLELIGTAKASLGTAGAALQEAAGRLQQTVRERAKQAEAARKRMQEVFARNELRSAWDYLNSNRRPQVEVSRMDSARIQEALQVIQERRPEEETASLFRQIPQEDVRKALATAEANAQAVERAYDPVSEALGQIDNVVQEQISQARPVQRVVRELEAATTDLPDGTGQPLADIRAAVAALARSSQIVKSAADELNTDFKAAWHGYHARRYREEANYNRQAAEMYEIQVRVSSALSERHRDRSKNFFYGMLAAQAGVTIATFSLAVKHKSILWGLASLAGVVAILFGLYVHLYM